MTKRSSSKAAQGNTSVSEAIATRRSVRDVAREMDVLSETELNEVLDVRHMTEPGVPGG